MRCVRRRWRTFGRPAILSSLYDLHPHAAAAVRRMRGVEIVPVDRIVGTTRHPSQVTADFLPLPELRGQNWRARWLRIRKAVDALAVLPPVDLLKVGDEYFVTDGHNRVAAARRAGVVGIDADVTELLLPGVTSDPTPQQTPTSMLETHALRRAGQGRVSRTVEQPADSDRIRRDELLRPEPEEP